MNNMVNEINRIIDSPQSYIISYYDDLQKKVDIEFITKLQAIQDAQLKEETKKQWTKLIDIINNCLAKSIKNEIPNEVIDKAKQLLNEIKRTKDLNFELKKLKHKIQSCLFSNNSSLAISIPKSEQILFLEQEACPREIEYFLTVTFEFIEKEIRNEKFNLLKINTISDDRNTRNKKNTVDIFYLKSFSNINHIEINLRSNSILNAKYLKRFSNLVYLDIYHANIEELKCLNDFKSLKTIIIEYSSIDHFDSIWVKDLSQLTDLCLNNLTLLTKLDLVYLGNLKNLELLSCNIRLIKDLFIDLINLEKLNLNSNRVLFLEEKCFTNLSKLKELHLSYCNISNLKESFLHGLENLSILDLSYNQRICLEKGCFNSVKNLKELNLCCCEIYELNEDILMDLVNLEVLDLSGNYFVRQQKNFFKRLKKLISLNVDYNACFKNLYSNVHIFDELNKLEQLKLSKCNNLEENFFVGLNSLKTLDLSNSPNISFEHGCFNDINQLTSLKLCDCNIFELEKNTFFGLDNLETLDLTGNPNMLLRNGCFDGLKNIKEIKK